MGRSLVKSLEG